jgi:hypothetical protein
MHGPVSAQCIGLKCSIDPRAKLTKTPVMAGARRKHIQLLNVASTMIGHVEKHRALEQATATAMSYMPA